MQIECSFEQRPPQNGFSGANPDCNSRRYTWLAASDPMNPGLYGPKVSDNNPNAQLASSLPMKPGLYIRPLLDTVGLTKMASMKAKAKTKKARELKDICDDSEQLSDQPTALYTREIGSTCRPQNKTSHWPSYSFPLHQ